MAFLTVTMSTSLRSRLAPSAWRKFRKRFPCVATIAQLFVNRIDCSKYHALILDRDFKLGYFARYDFRHVYCLRWNGAFHSVRNLCNLHFDATQGREARLGSNENRRNHRRAGNHTVRHSWTLGSPSEPDPVIQTKTLQPSYASRRYA